MCSTATWNAANIATAMRKAGYAVDNADIVSAQSTGREGYGRDTFAVSLKDGRNIDVIVRKDGKAYSTTSSAIPATPLQQVIRSFLNITKRGGCSALKKAKYTKNYKETEYNFIVYEHALTPFFTNKETFEASLVKAAEAGGYQVKSVALEQIWKPIGPERMVCFTIKTMCPYVI